MGSRAMSPVDHAWYRMDSPANLMMVHAIMWTDQPLDWDVLRDEVARRMLMRFPKFRQRAVPTDLPFARAAWGDDPDFDLDRHIVMHTLDAPGDQRGLERYISRQIHVALDAQHPPWEVHCIDGFGSGSAVLFRMHHSIADGITLTRVLLSLTGDEESGFTATEADRGPIQQAFALSRGVVEQGLRTVREPKRAVTALTVSYRGARRLLHLATIPQKPRSALSGVVGRDKQVTWTQPWPLDTVKSMARSAGVTVNDVLLSVLADALGRYLRAEETPLDSVRVMVPVNLRPLDRPLAEDLGNVFGEYIVTLPTSDLSPRERLLRMHDTTEELKDSPEAVVAYLTLVAIGYMPKPVEDVSTRLFSGKVVATVSNVPGPTSAIRLAGTEIAGIIGWVPGAGNVGLGVSMFSYRGSVVVGLITDATLIPDIDRLSGLLTEGFSDLEVEILGRS